MHNARVRQTNRERFDVGHAFVESTISLRETYDLIEHLRVVIKQSILSVM
jgi:hypothetical protein